MVCWFAEPGPHHGKRECWLQLTSLVLLENSINMPDNRLDQQYISITPALTSLNQYQFMLV